MTEKQSGRGSFAPGDQVRYRSGGPKMTVRLVDDEPVDPGRTETISCGWFDDTEFRTRRFYPEELARVDQEK